MEEREKNLTMEEAWICINFHFAQAGGLIARIEKGEVADDASMRLIKVALQRIKMEWENDLTISKKEFRLIWEIFPLLRLAKYILLYPERRHEISHFMNDLSIWMHHVFTVPITPEEAVVARVRKHLVGSVPSFSQILRMGRINSGSLEDLFDALDILSEEWKTKEYISKDAAYALISAHDIVWRVTGLYNDHEIERLHGIELQISEHITNALS